MHASHAFLTSLSVILCVAGVTTVLLQRMKQPAVLGYLLAGDTAAVEAAREALTAGGTATPNGL